jgi:hypothetical protein
MKVIHVAAIGLAAVIGVALVGPAAAKSARCYNSQDGYYNCNFEAVEGDGSFVIRARGYPTYTLLMDRTGFAYGYASYGGGDDGVSLPGMFVRQRDDGACWRNPEVDFEICAW